MNLLIPLTILLPLVAGIAILLVGKRAPWMAHVGVTASLLTPV